MNKEFLSWLGHTREDTCAIESAGMTYHFVRVRKNEAFDYLYCQRQYSGKELTRGGAFNYAGIFCRKDSELYDAQSDVQDLAGKDTQERSAGRLREYLQKSVRQLVETIVGNDRENLKITELTTPTLVKALGDYCKYYAKEAARKIYLATIDFEEPAYSCSYEPEYWTEDSLLSYILAPAEYAEKEAAAYYADHQEDILQSFLCGDALMEEYQALVGDTENPVHTVKKIMAAMNATAAKTVNVTICKDGEEFSFKTESQELRRDCMNYYSSWNIVAADRYRFEKQFGRSTNYYPQEIVRITYARAVLYEAGK